MNVYLYGNILLYDNIKKFYTISAYELNPLLYIFFDKKVFIIL